MTNVKLKKSNIIVTLSAVFIFFIYFVGAPYLTIFQMKTAIKNNDSAALSSHVDFVSLKQSLKDQMNMLMMKEMNELSKDNNPFAALGVAIGGSLVDKMVEAYVTPTGLAEIMKKGELDNKSRKTNNSVNNVDNRQEHKERDALENSELGYASINRFEAQISNEKDEKIVFVFFRHGLTWKLSEIILPSLN